MRQLFFIVVSCTVGTCCGVAVVARRTQLASLRQLKRERAHLRWLEQHLPQSTQLSSSKERIAALALQSAALSYSKQKKRCNSNAHQLRTLVHINVSEQAEDR